MARTHRTSPFTRSARARSANMLPLVAHLRSPDPLSLARRTSRRVLVVGRSALRPRSCVDPRARATRTSTLTRAVSSTLHRLTTGALVHSLRQLAVVSTIRRSVPPWSDASIVALSKCARGHSNPATVVPACARIAVPCAVRVTNVGCRSLPLRSQRHRPAALAGLTAAATAAAHAHAHAPAVGRRVAAALTPARRRSATTATTAPPCTTRPGSPTVDDLSRRHHGHASASAATVAACGRPPRPPTFTARRASPPR